MKNIDWKKLSLEDLALIIGKHLKENGINAVLVGGACVTIYSRFQYVSGDLDLIAHVENAKAKEILSKIGFQLEKNKYFVHKDTPYYIEFLTPPVSIGEEQISKFETKRSKLGEIKLLTPTDCVKDRLAAYYYWDDREALQQAVMVTKDQKVNMEEIKRWSKKEKRLEKYQDFKKALI